MRSSSPSSAASVARRHDWSRMKRIVIATALFASAASAQPTDPYGDPQPKKTDPKTEPKKDAKATPPALPAKDAKGTPAKDTSPKDGASGGAPAPAKAAPKDAPKDIP